MICGSPITFFAQVEPPGGGFGGIGGGFNLPNQSDSNNNVNKKKWSNPAPKIHYNYWNSTVEQQIDTSISELHFFEFFNTWTYDNGNVGTYKSNFLFSTDYNLGPQLYYQGYNNQFFKKENLPFYNTTRPYSLFNFSMASQQEQVVSITHTQNVDKRLNFALHFKNLNSQGFFNNHLAINNGGHFTSNYISKNQKYKIQAGAIYNKIRNDENGGIANDSLLVENNFVNTRQIPTIITSMPSNRNRSKVTNMYREMHGFFTHEYRIGQTDSVYNDDSTQLSINFKPEWSFRHDFDLRMRKHLYEDKIPNVNNYLFIDPTLVLIPNDTLRHDQRLNTIQNNFSINGFIGQIGKQLQIEAGIGNSIDHLSNKNRVNNSSTTFVNNYIFGQIRKEAATKTQWSYGAETKFYFAGSHIGNFHLHGYLSKYFDNIGHFSLEGQQSLTSTPYNITDYKTNYFEIKNDFGNISTTHLKAELGIEKAHLKVSFNNYTIHNYVYLDEYFTYRQHSDLINISHLEAEQTIRFKSISLTTKGFFQTKNENAPINLPNWGLSEIFSWNTNFYSDKLNLTTGLQARYIGPYNRVGYSYMYNQYYYNTNDTSFDNPIELMAFANFKIKNLRFYILGDQLQQLLYKKNVIYVKSQPMQSTMYRFGFKWTLYN